MGSSTKLQNCGLQSAVRSPHVCACALCTIIEFMRCSKNVSTNFVILYMSPFQSKDYILNPFYYILWSDC